jgi:murein DD-endopeptidase MepM/ murein hydrolase activator NlpD
MTQTRTPIEAAGWFTRATGAIFAPVNLPWIIRALFVRSATVVLLMTVTGCAASARPHPRSESRPQPAAAAASAEDGDESAPEGSPSGGPVGVYHKVQKGQNLFRIARNYGVTLEELCRANGIKDKRKVNAGQVLFIPGVPKKGLPSARRSPRIPGNDASSGTREARASLVGPDQAPLGVSYMLLPVDEPFSWPIPGGTPKSAFGARHGRLHAGVDISAPSGTDVLASRDGTVVYSGSRFHGYGNVVMVDHGDGFLTVYAHNSKNLVQMGERVMRGQVIARVGATGNATGSHCHFEIRKGQVAVDPQRYASMDSAPPETIAAGGGLGSMGSVDRAGLAPAHDPIP